MKKIKNENEFRELIIKYRSVTEEQLLEAEKTINFEYAKPPDFLNEITGFGSQRSCTLCTSVDRHCKRCMWGAKKGVYGEPYPCTSHHTYKSIGKAKTIKSLLKAVKNRADYMEKYLEKYLKRKEKNDGRTTKNLDNISSS